MLADRHPHLGEDPTPELAVPCPGRAELVIHTQRRLGRLSQDAESQREELLQEHGDVA